MTLPRHQRTRQSFSEIFERDHDETIAAMDDGGHDIPNQAPAIRLTLQRVGVKRHHIPVRLVDPFGSSETVQLSCSVVACLRLAADRRGIHVSRIGDLLARLSGEIYPSLQEYAVRVNESLLASQECGSARVAVAGVLSYLEEVSGVKQKSSIEHLDLFAASDFDEDRPSFSTGVGFSHITACPCVQETLRHSFSPNDSTRATATPLLTHTQRCQTRVTISNAVEALSLPALLTCIDAVVVRSQNTLPREFELLNVHRAHARPQFLEDAVRDLLFSVYQAIGPRAPAASIRIQTISFESIHDFDMEGEIEFAVEELDRIFAAPAGTANRNGSAADHPALVGAVRTLIGKTPADRCK